MTRLSVFVFALIALMQYQSVVGQLAKIRQPIIIEEPVPAPEPLPPQPITKPPPTQSTTVGPTKSATNEYFSVVASNGFRSNSKFRVSVTSHGYKTKFIIEVGIKSKSGAIIASSTVTVKTWSTANVILSIGSVSSGDYLFYARGIQNLGAYYKESPLPFLPKSNEVYVQTDKATYKPNDVINFRVVVLDSSLKAFDTSNSIAQIYVSDSNGNRIKQYNNATFVSGVFTNSIVLTENPPLGTWTITVILNGVQDSKTFVVDKYVLPKFKVDVTTIRHVTYADGKLTATIDSKYTYGQNVKGKLTVNVYRTWYTGSTDKSGGAILTREYPDFNGLIVVEYTYAELNFSPYQTDFIIEATVEEDLSGLTATDDGIVSVHQYPYQIEIIGETNYKPNFTYEATAIVSYWDGSPVIDTTNPVTVTVSNVVIYYYYNFRKPPQSTYSVTYNFTINNGVAKIQFTTPSNYDQLRVSANYKEVSGNWLTLNKEDNGINEYLQLSVETSNAKPGDTITVTAIGSTSFSYLTYLVVARGNIILSKTIQTANTNSLSFDFKATFDMTPKATVLAYYVSAGGYFVVDAVNVKLASVFQNYIKLSTSPSGIVKPGVDLNININTRPNSYVAILGVDQSVLLLKDGNDFDKNEILGSLTGYDGINRYDAEYPDFYNNKVIVITNVLPKPIPATTQSPIFLMRPQMMLKGAAPQMEMPMVAEAAPMEMAVDNLASAPAPAAAPRKFFPESWLFLDFPNVIDSSGRGQKKIQTKVPETITTWVLTSFSICPKTGFALVDEPTEITTFLKFFIRVELPYSIKRGETLAVKVVVFNYQAFATNATIKFSNSGEFEWAEFINAGDTANDAVRTKTVSVPSKDGVTVEFLITPKVVGNIILGISASAPNAADSVEVPLLVEAEGIVTYSVFGYLIDLRSNSLFNVNVPSGFPATYVSQSESITVSCVGDILGPAIKNLDRLIQMPYGCGEQNLITMVPTIYVMLYLTATFQVTIEIKTKAETYMDAGYQRQLTYIHPDGSFSAFGTSDPFGSTWLTALTLKSFVQADQFIFIDENILTRGFEFLIKRQNNDGSFTELGNVIHKEMQGGSSSGIAFISFVLSAFLESPVYATIHSVKLQLTISYLINNYNSNIDIFAHGILAYALQLTSHPQSSSIFDDFYARRTEQDGKIWWEKPIPPNSNNGYWYSQPNSNNVELSAYGLKACIKRGRIADAIKIAKWLMTQQNANGGFCSTQDTMVALSALAELAGIVYSSSQQINVVISSSSQSTALVINSGNAQVLQQVSINPNSTDLNISANGTGVGLCTVTYQYNVVAVKIFPSFLISASVEDISTQTFLSLRITASYIPNKDAADLISGMAVIEISFPSGFVCNTDNLDQLNSVSEYKMYEIKKSGTFLVLYFNYLNETGVNFAVTAIQTSKVANPKPVPVKVYDYYDTTKFAEDLYEPKPASLCDICNGAACLRCPPRPIPGPIPRPRPIPLPLPIEPVPIEEPMPIKQGPAVLLAEA